MTSPPSSPSPSSPAAIRARTGDAAVIISGGGPVGLCLALLAEQQILVSVIETEADIVRDLRASTFHPPLDMLEPFGITATLREHGLPCPTWQIRLHPSGDRAVFDLAVLEGDTRHPYRLQCEQWKLSEALLEKLQRSPFAEVRFASKVEAATDNGDHVSVEIENDGRRETLRARYAIGCDGARSAIRRSMGLPFEGLTYPETTLLVTTLFPFRSISKASRTSPTAGRRTATSACCACPAAGACRSIPDENIPIDDQMTPGARRQPADHRAAASPS
jgi:3-(3-hydroxy-phenyl)propionate hydroxylase